MRVERDRYLERLISRKNNGMVKVITGIRRCGKTYLLFNLFREHLVDSGVDDDHIIAINLDAKNNEMLRDGDALYRNITERIRDKGQYYLLLDEIQLVPGFESVLNGFVSSENVDVYVTGSNSRFLSSDIITEFRGRGDEVRVRPLSFSEFLSASKKDRYDALSDYMTYGGMPEILNLSDDEQKSSYLKGIFETAYLLDIKERNSIRMPYALDNLVDVVSSSIGSLVNATRIKNTLMTSGYRSMDEDTITRYLGYLEDSFLFERSRRYDVKGRRYISSTEKYYCADQGLSNARLNFRQLSDRPHIMENIIYNELRTRGFSVDVGAVPVRVPNDGKSEYRQLEVDFVANKGNRTYYIQSAFNISGEKEEQELRSLLRIRNSFKKIVITGDMMVPHQNDDGILFLGLMDFLLDEDVLNY